MNIRFWATKEVEDRKCPIRYVSYDCDDDGATVSISHVRAAWLNPDFRSDWQAFVDSFPELKSLSFIKGHHELAFENGAWKID